MSSDPLLSASLSVGYANRPGVLCEVGLEVYPGEVLGLVGQSGSGKSTLALALMRLLDTKKATCSGSVALNGRDLMRLSESEMRQVRGRELALVLQSPLSSLNPAMRIGSQLAEAWRAHASGSRADCRRAINEALASVVLPATDEFLRRYPGQLSVGQAQRVLIAIAVMHRPALLIADEPTSSLDVITVAEVFALFRRLNRERGMSILYISHDLPSVAAICDRVAILYEGKIAECGPTEEIFRQPRHPYTQQLVAVQLYRPDKETPASRE